jgi:hypothetical protein
MTNSLFNAKYFSNSKEERKREREKERKREREKERKREREKERKRERQCNISTTQTGKNNAVLGPCNSLTVALMSLGQRSVVLMSQHYTILLRFTSETHPFEY